jgi:cobalt-zinc-cadmium resistance protein CzcA
VAQLAYLRTVQDWIVRPQLRTVPGVADVDSLGGYVKEYLVEPDPAKIAAFGISYDDLADALEKANVSVGANYIQRSGEAYLVRADARVHSLDEIARAVVATRGGCRSPWGKSPRWKSAANCAEARRAVMAMKRWSVQR